MRRPPQIEREVCYAHVAASFGFSTKEKKNRKIPTL